MVKLTVKLPFALPVARTDETPVTGEMGQATTEYIILLSVVVLIFLGIARGIGKARLTEKMMTPLRNSYASSYAYGHPKAKGYDNGGPENHPRAQQTGGFRVFINPKGAGP